MQRRSSKAGTKADEKDAQDPNENSQVIIPAQRNQIIDLVSQTSQTIQDQGILQARVIEAVTLSLLEDNQKDNQQSGLQSIIDALGMNQDKETNEEDSPTPTYQQTIASMRILLALLTLAVKQKDDIQLDEMNYSLLKIILFMFHDLHQNKYDFEFCNLSPFLPFVVAFKQKLSKQKPTSKAKRIVLKEESNISPDSNELLSEITAFEKIIKTLKQPIIPSTPTLTQTPLIPSIPESPLIVTPQIKKQAKIAIIKDKDTAKKEMNEMQLLFKQKAAPKKPIYTILNELSELIRIDPNLIDELLSEQFSKFMLSKIIHGEDRLFIAYMNLIRVIIQSYHDAFRQINSDEQTNSDQKERKELEKTDEWKICKDSQGRSTIIQRIRYNHINRIISNNQLLLSSNKYVILSLFLLIQTIMQNEQQQFYDQYIPMDIIPKFIQRLNSFGSILKPHPSLDDCFDTSYSFSSSQGSQSQSSSQQDYQQPISLVELGLNVIFQYTLSSLYKTHIKKKVGIEIQSSLPQFLILYSRCSIGEEDDKQDKSSYDKQEKQEEEQEDEEQDDEEDSDNDIDDQDEEEDEKKGITAKKKQTVKKENKKGSKKAKKADKIEQQDFFMEDEDVAELSRSLRNKQNDKNLSSEEKDIRNKQKMRLYVIRAKCLFTHGLLADKQIDHKETLRMKKSLFELLNYNEKEDEGLLFKKQFGFIPKPREFSKTNQENRTIIINRNFIHNPNEELYGCIDFESRLAFWSYEVVRNTASKKQVANWIASEQLENVIIKDLKNIDSPRVILALDCLQYYYEINFTLHRQLVLIEKKINKQLKELDDQANSSVKGKYYKQMKKDDDDIKESIKTQPRQMDQNGQLQQFVNGDSILVKTDNHISLFKDISCIATTVIFCAMIKCSVVINFINEDRFLFKLFDMCKYDKSIALIRLNEYMQLQEKHPDQYKITNQYGKSVSQIPQINSLITQSININQTFITSTDGKVNLMITQAPSQQIEDQQTIDIIRQLPYHTIHRSYQYGRYWFINQNISKEFNMNNQNLISFLKSFNQSNVNTKYIEDIVLNSGLFDVMSTYMKCLNKNDIKSLLDIIYTTLKQIRPNQFPQTQVVRDSNGNMKLDQYPQLQLSQSSSSAFNIYSPLKVDVSSVPIHQIDKLNSNQSPNHQNSTPVIDFDDLYLTIIQQLDKQNVQDNRDGANSFSIAHLITQHLNYEERLNNENEQKIHELKKNIETCLMCDQKGRKYAYNYYVQTFGDDKSVEETIKEGIKQKEISKQEDENGYKDWLIRQYKLQLERVVYRKLIAKYGLIDILSSNKPDPNSSQQKSLCHMILAREKREQSDITGRYRHFTINGQHIQVPNTINLINVGNTGIDNDELELAQTDISRVIEQEYPENILQDLMRQKSSDEENSEDLDDSDINNKNQMYKDQDQDNNKDHEKEKDEQSDIIGKVKRKREFRTKIDDGQIDNISHDNLALKRGRTSEDSDSEE